MIKRQSFLKFALLSSTLPVYANEHAMASLLKDAWGNLPSSGVPDVSGILVQGNDDRKASIMHGGGRPVRMLQGMANCNTSRIDALWMDLTLNETFTTYANNFDTGATFGDCQQEGETALICPVQQTVDGEAEYQSACTAAGGQIVSIAADLSCDSINTSDGSDLSVYVDRPIFFLCTPTASDDFDDTCVESMVAALQNQLDKKAFLFEQGIISIGGSATDTSCRITTDEAPSAGTTSAGNATAGSTSASSSSAAKNGIGFVTMTMVVMSLIVGFHY